MCIGQIVAAVTGDRTGVGLGMGGGDWRPNRETGKAMGETAFHRENEGIRKGAGGWGHTRERDESVSPQEKRGCTGRVQGKTGGQMARMGVLPQVRRVAEGLPG